MKHYTGIQQVYINPNAKELARNSGTEIIIPEFLESKEKCRYYIKIKGQYILIPVGLE